MKKAKKAAKAVRPKVVAAGTTRARGPRAVEPQDGIIGQKIRIRRIELDMSQDELGQRLGVSFQQVQKYEKGVNRLSAGRLHSAAAILGVSTDYFYDNHSKQENEVQSLLYIDPKFSLRLLRAYTKLPQEQRRHIVSLIEAMTGQEPTVE